MPSTSAEGFEQKLLPSEMEVPVLPQSGHAASHEEEAGNVERVLKQMTLDEKVFLLSGRSMWTAGGVPRLKLDPMRVSDGPHGMRGFCLHGDNGAILAPCEMAMAASFDEDMITEVGNLLGEDCARRGGHVLLGPCINMQRTPLYGRHFECFSEDPYLSARAAVAYVKGVQKHVAACAKHFVCNDQEDNRHTMNAVIDERTLREVYLAPFEAAVKEGDVESIMCGYNRMNGSFCSENMWLLQQVLREEWKYRGWLISDWFGNQSTVPAITAGLNVEMPGIEPRHYGGYLLDAAKKGRVAEDLLDERCRPVLRTMLRHAGKPLPGASTTSPDPAKRRRVMQQASAASHVLLRNEGNALPLDPGVLRRVAVIGPCAAESTLQGGGSSRTRPKVCATILESLRAALPNGTVMHEPGCYVGDLPHTSAEYEALKPIAACDGSGQPRGSQITLVFDVALVVFSAISNIECFRRYCMPVLRVLGLRQTDPVKAAAAEARQHAHKKPAGNNDSSASGLDSPLVCCASLVGAALGGLFAAGAMGQGWPRLRAAAGILAAVILAAQAYRVRSQALARRSDERQLRAAEETARTADASILVLGSSGFFECEGLDRPHMFMPGRQNELVERVVAAAAGKPVVVVLNVGSPKELPWLSSVSAVLLVHYGGEEMGAAVADTLLGVSSPAGRLPMTWPRRLEDAPVVTSARHLLEGAATPKDTPREGIENTTLLGAPTTRTRVAEPGETVYHEGLRIGYRAFGEGGFMGSVTPLFPFGHGLSYTTFEYGPAEVEITGKCVSDGGARVVVRVSIKNSGRKAGAEVAQVYTEAKCLDDKGPAAGPRALRCFARTPVLAPGEEKRVVFDLDSRALGDAYSIEAGSWISPRPGQSVRIDIGGSSADIRRTTTIVLE